MVNRNIVVLYNLEPFFFQQNYCVLYCTQYNLGTWKQNEEIKSMDMCVQLHKCYRLISVMKT